MLAMYLSTPLNRSTYLSAKAIAVLLTLGLVTLGPPLLLLLGYTAEGAGPDGLASWLTVLFRIVLSGLAVSMPVMAISMAASSITDRRAFAAIGVVLVIISLQAVAATVTEAAEWSQSWFLISPLWMSFELVLRIFAVPGSGSIDETRLVFADVPTATVLGSCIAWTVGGLGVVGWRYSRLVIAR
jgi:ABC-2 type transport system permease protein